MQPAQTTPGRTRLRATCAIGLLASILFTAVSCRTPTPPEALQVSAATFRCDVTPPLGHPLCGGWIRPLEAVDDPLLAKGILLHQGTNRFVLCSVDWCLLQTGAYDLFRTKLAHAANAPLDHVTVHTVHQHNAPIADANAERLLRGATSAPAHLDLAFLDRATDQLARAVRNAASRLEPVTHIGTGRARVERFASNRRVRLADGQIHVRYSSTRDPALQAAPEGQIDPWLRTVTLFNHHHPIARLHYYATHPMSFYGDGRATADTVGLARERLENLEHIPQIYFTGCGGNITPGKYNDGTPRARTDLTDRIFNAMTQAVANTQRVPLRRFHWQTTDVPFALRAEPEWSETTARTTLHNTNATTTQRLTAALDLAWIERAHQNPAIQLSALDLGPVTLLHLPGEAFVEYQLYAQAIRPDTLIATAAYGESGPGYICTDLALQLGGYEPTMSRVGPPSEFNLKDGIARLLQPAPTTHLTPFYPDKLHLLAWRDSNGFEHPVRSPEDWTRRRAHILSNFSQVAGPAPTRTDSPAPHLRVLDETSLGDVLRQRIEFEAEPGDWVPAFLFRPRTHTQRSPAALCLHQTTPAGKAEPAGLTGSPNLHYALELAQRGWITLAPDYPGFGDNHTDPYALGYQSATMKGIHNHRRALDLLESLPEVDPHQIAALGHSLGGHNALFLATVDERVRAVVSSCGFNSFSHYQAGDLTGWSHRGYMPRIASLYHCDARQMPFDFTELLASLAPRPVFVAAPVHDDNFPLAGVHECLAAARPVYHLLDAKDQLQIAQPECGHDFPPDTRLAAYAWLENVLHVHFPDSAVSTNSTRSAN